MEHIVWLLSSRLNLSYLCVQFECLVFECIVILLNWSNFAHIICGHAILNIQAQNLHT